MEMEHLAEIETIKNLLARHGFRPDRALGQNFIANPELCPRIAQAGVPGPEFGVLEIGPGVGALTVELAKRAKKVVAVEVDRALLPVLGETLAEYGNVEIVNADFLKLDLPALVREKFGGMPLAVCANLPYYITTPVLTRIFESGIGAQSVVVMVQKEAADRFLARPGTRQSEAGTVLLHYFCEPEILFSVPREWFSPSPQCGSAVLKCAVYTEPPVAPREEKRFFSVVKAAFLQRRKTLANSLSAGLGVEKAKAAAAIAACGLAPGVRAEELTLRDFSALSDALTDAGAFPSPEDER